MKLFLKIFNHVFQSLTIRWQGLPMESSAKIHAQVMVFYPLAGLFLGVILNFLHRAFQVILPEDIVDFLVIIAWIIFSRASHVIGLASTLNIASNNFETESSPAPANQRLSTLTVILLILMQLIKFFSLLHVAHILKAVAILSMPIISFWAIIWACCLSSSSTNSSEIDVTSWPKSRPLIISSTVTFGLLFLFLKLKSMPAIFLVMFTIFILIKWIQRKDPEMTESALGASHELGGTVFLISLQISSFVSGF